MELEDRHAPRYEKQERRKMTRLLVHLDAAYNLARWLTRNEQDAEDVVQEAYLRAFSYFSSFDGGDGRGWLLTIVRNTYYNWLKQNRVHDPTIPFEEDANSTRSGAPNPETLAIEQERIHLLREALDNLPAEFRKVLVLREMKGLSYHQIASVARVPIGTVMSRLSRARKLLQRNLMHRQANRRCTPELDYDGGGHVFARYAE